MHEFFDSAMSPMPTAPTSIWLQARAAQRSHGTDVSIFPAGRHSIVPPSSRLPITSLTAGQGKTRTAA
jgi:hypothetical protein